MTTKRRPSARWSFTTASPMSKRRGDFVKGIVRGKTGPVCPKCGNQRHAARSHRPGWHRCKDCRADYSMTMGIVFESSKIGFRKWLYATYLLQTARKGISSLQLSKEIGTTQKTAWFMLHRLREACGDDPSALPLSGKVEMDATYLGGKEGNKHGGKKMKAGRGTVGKQPVIGMRERGGRTAAHAVDGETADTISRLASSTIDLGSTVCTDESRAYHRGLGSGFRHRRSIIRQRSLSMAWPTPTESRACGQC